MEANGRSALSSFLRRVGRWIRNYFIVLGVLVTLLFILLGRTLVQKKALLKDPGLGPQEQAVLHLKLAGQIRDSSPEMGVLEQIFRQMLGQDQDLYLLELKAKLEKAALDQRVKGLLLEISDLHGSMANFTELRQILAKFKAANKPISSWFASADNKTFYLATIADAIYMAPVGDLSIPGPSFDLVYFGEALKKLGIEVEVIRAGKFKSAFEPLVLNRPSPETLSMYEAMEKSLRDHLVEEVAKGRQLNQPDLARQWFQRSLFTPQLAQEQGLVDELSYIDEVKRHLESQWKAKCFAFEKYKEHEPLFNLAQDKGPTHAIALIEAVGEIHMDAAAAGDREVILPRQMKKELEWAMREKRVKAVVLRIVSPGGSATASDLIWQDVHRLAQEKPVVVSMGAYAASGGYYMAAPASKIFALPTTITGSIGVIGLKPNFKAFDDKYGVSFHVVTESARRDLLNPGKRASQEDKALLEQSIDSVYQSFLKKVSEGRGMALAEVEALAQGRVWTGSQAKEHGLVDELGGLDEAFMEAKKLANIDPALKVPVLRWQPDIHSLTDCLAHMSECFPSSQARAALWQLSDLGVPKHLRSLHELQRWAQSAHAQPVQAVWLGYLGQH